MEFLADIALFALKTLLIAGSFVVVVGLIIQMSSGNARKRTSIEVEKLNTRYRAYRQHLQRHLLGKKQFKSLVKTEKKEDKGQDGAKPGRVYVLDFDGDIRATAVASLREEISAILSVAQPDDEVVLRLESGGGLVTSYGLAASQLARLRQANVKLTVTVDKVAASGGYMMACVADKILAAPFAVVGSIGVIAQVPNFNRVLKKHDVDYKEVTAGEFKRTVTIFGEITEPGMAKFREQIEGTHKLFKEFVIANRPKVDLARVATGEHWYGTEAIGLGLVDELITSDDYLFQKYPNLDVFRVRYLQRKKLMDRFSEAAMTALRHSIFKIWSDLEQHKF